MINLLDVVDDSIEFALIMVDCMFQVGYYSIISLLLYIACFIQVPFRSRVLRQPPISLSLINK